MPKTTISISDPTPKWATWVFRIVFLLTMVALPIIVTDPAIPDPVKLRLALYLKALDGVVWGIGRAIGVKKEDYEQ